MVNCMVGYLVICVNLIHIYWIFWLFTPHILEITHETFVTSIWTGSFMQGHVVFRALVVQYTGTLITLKS